MTTDTVSDHEDNEILKRAITVNEEEVGGHLKKLVRKSVEETLNDLLDAEADEICGAKRYERSPDRVDFRSGHYERSLATSAGPVKLQVPKLRKLPFESQIIERYRRRESSVEEALVEMYLAGVSVRRVEDITEALWGSRVSSSTISELNQKVYERIEEWRNLPIQGSHPYVYLDGIWLKRSWGGEVTNVAVLVAIGVNSDGFREILGIHEGCKESHESWLEFLRWLQKRGLQAPSLMISDACSGLIQAISEVYPTSKWQRCMFHFHQNVIGKVPRRSTRAVADMLRAIHAQEDKDSARAKAEQVAKKLEGMKLSKAAETLRSGIEETLTYFDFPREHQRRIRTNNVLERLNKEIRRRTRVVGAFPDGQSALMLAAARLRYVASKDWGSRRYLNMKLLLQPDAEAA